MARCIAPGTRTLCFRAGGDEALRSQVYAGYACHGAVSSHEMIAVPLMRCGMQCRSADPGRSKFRVWKGPGSAKQCYTLHRAPDMRNLILRDARKMRAPQDEERGDAECFF